MAGYTRQSSGLIVTSATILASHSENEFAALGTAFGASGHDHSGSGGNGPQILAGGIASDAVTTAKILDANVTYAKIQNVSATDKILGRVSASAGVIEEITFTDAAQQLADDTTHTAMLVTLGFTATITELNYTSGVTSAIQTQLDAKQTSDATLTALAGVTVAADKVIYATGADAFAITDLPSFGRTLIANTSAGDARTDLGVVIGTDVQAYDADTLKADVTDTLTVGFNVTDYSAGTKSSGTYTPDPALGNQQYAVNGGAHTLAPPASSCTMVIQYTNNGSAGVITTSGFTKVDGSFTTTNGDDFMCFISVVNAFKYLNIVRLQ